MKSRVRVNERGLRIGESHPRAVLSDADVALLIADRGADEDHPAMSLSALARKWGMSKSGVKGILDGRRRGQIGPTVDRAPSRRAAHPKVRVKMSITLHHRAKLHRLGGSVWLTKKIDES